MKSFDDIYKYLRENLLPVLREKAIKDDWPGIWKRSLFNVCIGNVCLFIKIIFAISLRHIKHRYG